MNLIENFIAVLRKYAVFSGRARRREYWLFMLCGIILSFVFNVLALIPGIHYLVVLIPLVGLILLIMWTAKEGVSGANEYGPNPKAA